MVVWDGISSRESHKVAEGETVDNVEGNMDGTDMRGAGALPRFETPSRTKETRRNLGDHISPGAAKAAPGHDGKSRRRSHRGKDEESDGCIISVKPRTKLIRGSVAKMVEGSRPAGGKASSNACPGLCAGHGMSRKLGVYGSDVHGPPKPRTSIALDLRQEPYA